MRYKIFREAKKDYFVLVDMHHLRIFGGSPIPFFYCLYKENIKPDVLKRNNYKEKIEYFKRKNSAIIKSLNYKVKDYAEGYENYTLEGVTLSFRKKI